MIEMPHIALGDKVVDLELEVKSKLSKKELIQYFKDWISGKPMKSKTPGFIQKLDKENIPLFIKELLKKPFLKNFVEFHYDPDTWNELEKMLKSQ